MLCPLCFCIYFSVRVCLTVLWPGLPRQPAPSPEDLPVGRTERRDVQTLRHGDTGGGHRESGGQRGQTETDGDLQQRLLPPSSLWLPVPHGRHGTVHVLQSFLLLLLIAVALIKTWVWSLGRAECFCDAVISNCWLPHLPLCSVCGCRWEWCVHSSHWKASCSRGVNSCSPASPHSRLRMKRSGVFLLSWILFIHLVRLPLCVNRSSCYTSFLIRWKKPWRPLCPPSKTWWRWRTTMSLSASTTATAWSRSSPLSVNPISASRAWPNDVPTSRRLSSFTSRSVSTISQPLFVSFPALTYKNMCLCVCCRSRRSFWKAGTWSPSWRPSVTSSRRPWERVSGTVKVSFISFRHCPCVSCLCERVCLCLCALGAPSSIIRGGRAWCPEAEQGSRSEKWIV